jgi:hypothetical protein
VGRIDRGAYRLALQPRLYPSFPGRGSTGLALEASAQRNLGDFGISAGAGWLTPYRSASGGYAYSQQGFSLSADLRYYWSYSRWGALFAGPRAEWWMISQEMNGAEAQGRMAGALASLGFERAVFGRGSLLAAVDAGYLWHYDGLGRLRMDPVFPLTLSIRFGP